MRKVRGRKEGKGKDSYSCIMSRRVRRKNKIKRARENRDEEGKSIEGNKGRKTLKKRRRTGRKEECGKVLV